MFVDDVLKFIIVKINIQLCKLGDDEQRRLTATTYQK